MWGRAVRAKSLDECSRHVIRGGCTVSPAYDRYFYMHGVLYVPMCADVRFVPDRLMGTHIRYVRARDSCKIA